MIYMSNLVPTFPLEILSPFEVSIGKAPILSHLRLLRSTVYVFIYEEERRAKSGKWELRGKRDILVNYDGHTIYQVYLAKNEKVI